MSQEKKYREHPRKPTKRIYVPPVELAIGPRWNVRVEALYSPVYRPVVKVSFTGDDPGKPFVILLHAGEVRTVIDALEAAEVAL